MAQQAPLEPGSALYDFAQTVDVNKLPDKLRCKSCDKFLLNAFKTACCEDGICEPCTTAAAGSACPICKHSPLVTNIGKALRSTARNYLKIQMAEANKAAEPVSNAAPESKEASVVAQEDLKTPTTNGQAVGDDQMQDSSLAPQEPQNEAVQPEDIVQSIETQREGSRRPTIVSASGNEPDDDDIQINVGLEEYEYSQIPDGSKRTPVDEVEQWPDEQVYEKPRKNSTLPHSQNQNQNQNQSFHGSTPFNDFDNSGVNQNMNTVQNDQQLWDMMQSGGMNNMNPMFAMMQNQPMMQQMMQQMQQMQANGMMQNFPGMQYMQSMGMMPQMGMNGQNQNWPGNMMNMMNSNFNSMMNNGASFNSSQQQYQQNYQNGDYRFNRNGSFDRGRGRGRGRNKFRGGFNNQFSHQDQFAGFNNMPFQNQYNQGPMQNQQNQYDNNAQEGYQANSSKETIDQLADDDDFAPGGQDEVQEALGDSYNNKQQSNPPDEAKVEDACAEESKQEDYQREPSPAAVEQTPVYESPKQEPKETYIPEAYREDLDFPSAPPSAPLGPASKDVPYRARGHGRFPSRGRGSYQGSVGFPPRSPARPVSQHQTNSPPTNQGSGVVGAPTGPRAMREKEAPPPPKSLSRSESDVGFKIRGTATQAREQRVKEDQPRNATPQSNHDDYDDREKDSSRRHSKYDRKHDSSRYQESADDYDDRDRRRRKSRREEDYDHDMQDVDYSRSDSQDRSHRSGRKDKDRTRDKYSSGVSKHKSSSRKYDDDYEDDRDDANDYGDEVSSRSKSKKSGSKYEDRDERRDRDYERAEKDKHRKRSRHDRDRDDDVEDADEEESRRRSRRHKKDHRKDRDRDTEASTDLGMRITGRSSAHRTSEMTTPNSNTPALSDKDPHTLEREARDRERMLKEQQRRQNAMANQKGLSGGRTRSFKYEDEIERSLNKPSRRR